MREIDKVLDNEKILWEGKPKFLPFIFSSVLTIILTILLVFVYLVLENEINYEYLTNFLMVGLFLIVIILIFIFRLLTFYVTHYAITDKRLIIQKGIIGRDFNIIDYDKITGIEVNVKLVDKIFGNSGSILIQTPDSFRNTRYGSVAAPHRFLHVQEPYEVFKILKNLSFNVKTDINFPNQYRPNTNEGYKTRLK